jgi:hypothetical protein
MMEIIAGLVLGIVLGLLLPVGIAVAFIAVLVILILLPQFSMIKGPALIMLLVTALVLVARIFMAGHIIAGA